jgi:hypothetical protein
MEEEEVLVATEFAMIASCRLFLFLDMEMRVGKTVPAVSPIP